MTVFAPSKKLRRWYWRFRKKIARYVPDPVQGVGFSAPQDEPLDAGEVHMILDVEGRTGSVYLSEDMWRALGEKGGWIERAR